MMTPKAFVYLDNFRGFSQELIPLYDVNFLVGENSTGKTSFLSILKIVSGSDLIFYQGFPRNKDIDLGLFKDMVSKTSEDQKQFTIGLVKNNSLGLLRFEESPNGEALIYRFSFATSESLFHGAISQDKFMFKSISFQKSEDTILSILDKCISEQKQSLQGYGCLDFRWNESISIQSNLISLIINKNEIAQGFDWTQFNDFSEVLKRLRIAQTFWFSPIRTKLARTYDRYIGTNSPDGTHTPYLLNKLLHKNIESNDFLSQLRNLLTEFGKNSGLFDAIEIKKYSEEIDAPFEVRIRINNQSLRSIHVGYGVSQILPIIVDLLIYSSNSWFAIQQPEIHLHPKAQAEFGELIFRLSSLSKLEERGCFLIETHSDYIIDRFRYNYLEYEGENPPPSAQVLFFERTAENNKIHSLPIDTQGRYPEEQPKSFRDFFIKEDLKLLRL
jgi:predicted ATPase